MKLYSINIKASNLKSHNSFTFSFLDAEKNVVGSCDYYLNTNDFQYVDPVKYSKFVSIKHKNFVMTFDMLDKRNYGKIV